MKKTQWLSSSRLMLGVSCPSRRTQTPGYRSGLATCGPGLQGRFMDIPDGIPRICSTRRECVIVIPSVLKLAFGVGR